MTEIQAVDVRLPAELNVVRSVAATVVSMLFIGWLLLFAAGIEIGQALMVGKWAGLYQHCFSAVLSGVRRVFVTN